LSQPIDRSKNGTRSSPTPPALPRYGSPAASCRCDGDRRRQLSCSGEPTGSGRQAEEEMTPPATADPDPANYVAAVLILYVELPEMPLRASIQDRWHADVCTIVESPFASSNPLSCWHRCAGWSDLRMVHHCRRFDPWPTSCLSMNSWRILHLIITWNTCGSSYANWLSARMARPKSRKGRLQMIANTGRLSSHPDGRETKLWGDRS
jgi:hypothetical protein